MFTPKGDLVTTPSDILFKQKTIDGVATFALL